MSNEMRKQIDSFKQKMLNEVYSDKDMNNQVTKIFTDMTDMELSQAIGEMKEDNQQGIIRKDGIVRQKCKKVQDIIGGGIYDQLTMVQSSIIQEAAFRFTPTL
jgi:uncharacterized membrane-anchored protein YjiN (DUF445 family)